MPTDADIAISPLSYGVPRVDDRRVTRGIIYVIKHELQWKDATKAYGPHKTLHNRFVRWRLLGVFKRVFTTLARGAKTERIMINATPKDWRRIATRYDRYANTFLAAIRLAGAVALYLKE